jgi:hypothetical protein
MMIPFGQLVDFLFGLGGLRFDNHILLTGSGFDLDGDLLWAWGFGSGAIVGGDADSRDLYLSGIPKRGATSRHGSNSAGSIGDDRGKITLCWPCRSTSCDSGRNRLVHPGNLTIKLSVRFGDVVPGRVTRSRLTRVRRTYQE